MRVTYGDLYEFISDRVSIEEIELGWRIRGCGHDYKLVQHFCEMHDLFFGELTQRLLDFGARCDCGVILNVARQIPNEIVVNDETFLSPREIAIEMGWYVHCLADGEPCNLFECVHARDELGLPTQFWVPCEPDAPYAHPDINRAMEEFERRYGF